MVACQWNISSATGPATHNKSHQKRPVICANTSITRRLKRPHNKSSHQQVLAHLRPTDPLTQGPKTAKTFNMDKKNETKKQETKAAIVSVARNT